MSLEELRERIKELREHIKAEELDNADYIGDDDHIPDAGKMPWANEPTPLANQSAVEEYSPRLKMYVDLETARGLERRMRAAERLLSDKRQITIQYQDWYRDADAHLEAARKEDGQ